MNPHVWRHHRGASLTLVFVLAKTMAAWASGVPHTLWLFPALFWDDVAVGAVFWIVDFAIRRPRWMWWPYGALAGWAALNVPIVWTLGSAMTWPMLRAARGPLADSIRVNLTPANLLAIAVVGAAAARLPSVLSRTNRAVRAAFVAIGIVLLAVAPLAASRIDLNGRERNAVTTLLATSRTRVTGVGDDRDWRESPFAGSVAADLSSLRGAARGMNVVLVALESTAARYLRAYGAADDPTPYFTALAARSLVFERAYTVYPESIKGLFSTLCSRDPGFDVPVDVLAASPCPSLVRALSSHGYRTGLFHSGRFAYLGMDDVVRGQGFDAALDAGAIGGRVESSFGVDDRSTVLRMLSWIDDDRARPFFLTYLPTSGHHPYATSKPGPFHGDDELTAYKNALHEGDEALGVLIDGLRARGLEDSTLVVVYGDHGEAFGQHAGNVGHTMFVYDENVRVPLTVTIPREAGTRRIPDVASTVDIAPTVVDLLGLPALTDQHGASLLAARPRVAFFYTDYSLPLAGLQDGCWKYQFQIDRARSALFDTCADPDERTDRAAGEPVRVQAYRARVEGWVAARRAALVSSTGSAPRSSE